MNQISKITTDDWWLIVLALFLPPFAVTIKKDFEMEFFISLALWPCFHFPSVVYAIYIVATNLEKTP